MSYSAVAGHLSKTGVPLGVFQTLEGCAIFTQGPFLSVIKQTDMRGTFGVLSTPFMFLLRPANSRPDGAIQGKKHWDCRQTVMRERERCVCPVLFC